MAPSDDELLSDEELHLNGGPTRRSETSQRRGNFFPTNSRRRQDVNLSAMPVGELVQALMAGGLASSMERIAMQQAARVIGDITDTTMTNAALKADQGGSVRRSLQLGSEMVDHFDPDDPESDIEQWVQKIDQLGTINGWSHFERTTLAQSKLEGAARRWLHRLGDFSGSWQTWKTKLREAFSRRPDFAFMLEELTSRRKLPSESMTTYYYSKLALCYRVNIRGEEAISCIIRGLPEELRADAQAADCTSPEALYHSFLAGLEEYHGDVARNEEEPRRQRARSEEEPRRQMARNEEEPRRQISAYRQSSSRDIEVKRRCFNCQKITTHLSKNCPYPRADRCRICSATGHQAHSCPKQEGRERFPAAANQDGRINRESGARGSFGVGTKKRRI